MATLHLMVGLPCSGKTTAARELERKYSALRLTTDEWHLRLFGDDYGGEAHDAGHEALHGERHRVVEALLWDVAARSLILGVNVVLDFGCWTRAEREDFRSRAHRLGAEYRIHFLDVPQQVLLDRLASRNSRPDGTFYIPERKLREWFELFEAPTGDELERP